jgi:hypothetical protein
MAGGFVGIQTDDPDDQTEVKDGLTRETCLAGLCRMAEKHPRHFADWRDENDDAETGDVFLQLVVLHDIVFS